MEYTIYIKETGKIKRIVDVPKSMIDIQLATGEAYLPGYSDEITQKVANGTLVDKTSSEVNDYSYLLIKNTTPIIDPTLTDTELNYFLDTYFSGKENIDQWRIDKYAELREQSYPDLEIKADAEVKINSGVTEIEKAGNDQLSKYYTDCLAVKTRFPKE